MSIRNYSEMSIRINSIFLTLIQEYERDENPSHQSKYFDKSKEPNY